MWLYWVSCNTILDLDLFYTIYIHTYMDQTVKTMILDRSFYL